MVPLQTVYSVYLSNRVMASRAFDLLINAETFGAAPTPLYGNYVMGEEDGIITCETN